MSVRKADGSDYEPDTLEFTASQEVLASKGKEIKKEKGSRPNTAELLNKTKSSTAKQNLVQQHVLFGLRGRTENHNCEGVTSYLRYCIHTQCIVLFCIAL